MYRIRTSRRAPPITLHHRYNATQAVFQNTALIYNHDM